MLLCQSKRKRHVWSDVSLPAPIIHPSSGYSQTKSLSLILNQTLPEKITMTGESSMRRRVVRKAADLIRHSLSSSQASSAQLHQPRFAANTAIKKGYAQLLTTWHNSLPH
jgi:hypothetical protein